MKILKSINKYLFLSFLMIGVSSCGDDFLEGNSSNIVTGTEMEEGEALENAKSYLSGCYTLLFNQDIIGLQEYHDDFSLRAIMLATDVMAEDIAMPNGFMFDFDYENGNRGVGYRRTRTMWKQMYKIIFQANETLKILESMEDPTDEAVRMTGEAKALRGYLYFILINLYQQPYQIDKDAPGIPIYTTTEAKRGRNPVSEVYDLILSDLTSAYEILKGRGISTPVEMNEYTVAGMLARVLCFVNDYPNQWQEVAKYADSATRGKPLLDNAGMLAGFNSISTNEVIWGSAINDETNTYYASFMSIIDPMSIGYAPMGYFLCIASELHNKIDPNDIRFQWFVDVPSPSANGVPMPRGTALKFKDVSKSLSSDYIYMRTAEMYYLKAEALYLANDQPGARAALEDVMTTRLSGYSAIDLSGDALLKEIRIQKRIEMWGDGFRLFDMKWRVEDMDRRGSTNHVQTYPLFIEANGVDWVFPIPQVEMDANIEITENNP